MAGMKKKKIFDTKKNFDPGAEKCFEYHKSQKKKKKKWKKKKYCEKKILDKKKIFEPVWKVFQMAYNIQKWKDKAKEKLNFYEEKYGCW